MSDPAVPINLPLKEPPRTWKAWAKGLAVAFGSGLGAAIYAAYLDPHLGMEAIYTMDPTLLKLAGGLAITHVAAYLKTSPVPKD